MNKFVFTLIFSLCAMVATAQEVEFKADRPGASTGPATVARKVVQLEQEVLNCRQHINIVGDMLDLVNEAIARYEDHLRGIVERYKLIL